MQKIILMLLLSLLFLIGACTQKTAHKEIPITTSSELARELFIQGRDNIENGEYVNAAKLLDQALKKDSNFIMAYCYRVISGGGSQAMYHNLNKAKSLTYKASSGEKLFVNLLGSAIDNNHNEVQFYIDTLTSMYPDDKHLMLFAGFYYQSVKDYPDAARFYMKASEIDSTFAPAYNVLGYLNVHSENYQAAESNFKKYIQLMPDRPNPYDSYAEFLLKRGRYDESIEQYRQAFSIDSTFTSALIGEGNNYIFKNDFIAARECYNEYFQKSVQIEDKLNALFLKGVSYVYEEKLDDAIKCFDDQRALAEQENEPSTVLSSYLWQGFILSEMGKPSDGLKIIKDADSVVDVLNFTEAERENRKVNLNNWMAYGLYSNKMMKEAKARLALYTKDVERRNIPEEKSTAVQHQSIIDFMEGRYDDAIAKLSNIEPDPLRLYYLARTYLKKGNKNEAVRLLKKIHNWNQNSLSLAVVWTRAHRDLADNTD